jgi:hypothetical protein
MAVPTSPEARTATPSATKTSRRLCRITNTLAQIASRIAHGAPYKRRKRPRVTHVPTVARTFNPLHFGVEQFRHYFAALLVVVLCD